MIIYIYINIYREREEGAFGNTILVAWNRVTDPSSNPGQSWLFFYFTLITVKKALVYLFRPTIDK